MATPFLFAEDLTDDVLSQSVLFCKAPDALSTAGTCRALHATVEVTAHRLYTTLFGSPTLPACLLVCRSRLLALLDRARSSNPEFVRTTFSWAASQGLCTYLSRVAASWCQSDLASLVDHHGSDNGTALCRAAKKQREEAVALLLELRADPDLAGKGGLTPLFWAARCGHPGIVQRLLQSGASPIKCGKRGDCPLGAALGTDGVTPGKIEALRQLTEQLDTPQRNCVAAVKALHDACAAGEAQIVEILVDFGIGLAMPIPGVTVSTSGVPPSSTQPPDSNSGGQWPQATASEVRDRPPAPPVRPGSAAPTGGAGSLIGAVAIPAPLSQRPPTQRPGAQRPRSGRSRRGSISVSTPNTSTGGAVSSTATTFGSDTDFQESTPLLAAVGKGFSDVVFVLLRRHVQSNAYINASLPSGKSALHLAAERGDAEICAKLLEAGASIGATTCSGRSALFAAVEHGHVGAVRAICEKAEVWHLTQQTPSGVSPLTLAERRGKPALILPLLRCYHGHVQKRFLLRQPGEPVTDITDPYLTLLCLKFKDQLFRQSGCKGESANEVSLVRGRQGEPLSQTSRLALQTAVEGESLGEQTANSGAPDRYTRVMEQKRIGPNGMVEGRGRLRCQMDLPDENPQVTKARPQSARIGGAPQSRRRSEAPPSVGETVAATRKPWGSAAASRRQRPASATTRRSGSRKVVTRTSSGELWQRASTVPRQCDEAYRIRSGLSSTIVAGPIGAALRPQAVTDGGWCQGGCASWPLGSHNHNDREEAAIEADDAMAELLAGYLCEEEECVAVGDGEECGDFRIDIDFPNGMLTQQSPPLPFTANFKPSVVCDLAMYSDDSGDEEVQTSGAHGEPAVRCGVR